MKSAQWILKSHPKGQVAASDFECVDTEIGEPGDGQVLGKTLYLSMEAAMRRWIADSDEKGYRLRINEGDVMYGPSVIQVVKSRHPHFAEGDLLIGGTFGWREYVISSCEPTYLGDVKKLPEDMDPRLALSVLGGTGLAAYFGVVEAGGLKPGDKVLVSGAAGATGSVAVQVARIMGAEKVVGIAGGPEKCRWLVEEAGCHGAVDYKNGDLLEQLVKEFPKGIDLYVDIVGGEILDTALLRMARKGRVAICGNTSAYDGNDEQKGPRNMFRVIAASLTIKGLIFDYMDRADEALSNMAGWLKSGEMKAQLDVMDGFENAPSAFVRLFSGGNVGKQLVKIADPA